MRSFAIEDLSMYRDALRAGRGLQVMRKAGYVKPDATDAQAAKELAVLLERGVLRLVLSPEPVGATGHELVLSGGTDER